MYRHTAYTSLAMKKKFWVKMHYTIDELNNTME
jgi:hypothetical protein